MPTTLSFLSVHHRSLLMGAPLFLCVALVSPSPLAGRLIDADAMSAARMAHTATTLADGSVLVAGGFADRSLANKSAQLFDVRTRRFLALPAMGTPRYSHSATLLPDGRVLLAGGYADGGSQTASAELFDPKTRTFAATGSLRQPRSDHVAVPLADGRVLIAGGLGPGWSFLASAEIYDPRTGTFAATGPMTVARESHVGVRLNDGTVLIVGGHRDRRENITLYASTEVYDPRTGTFTRGAEMRVRRHKHDAVLLPDGRVLVTGGSDERDNRGVYTSTEIYDPVTRRFRDGPALQRGRYKHANSARVLPGGQVLLAGGAEEAELFDPVKQTFTLVSGAPRMAGQFSASALLPGGGVLITGGYGGGTGPRASAWEYQP